MSKPTTVRFEAEDLIAIETIKQKYGISTDSDAIRFALRIVSQAEIRMSVRGGKKGAKS